MRYQESEGGRPVVFFTTEMVEDVINGAQPLVRQLLDDRTITVVEMSAVQDEPLRFGLNGPGVRKLSSWQLEACGEIIVDNIRRVAAYRDN